LTVYQASDNDIMRISTLRTTAIERRAKDWTTEFWFLDELMKFLSQRPHPKKVWRLSAILSSVQWRFVAVCVMAVRKTLWPVLLLQKDIVTNYSTAERHCDQFFYCRKTLLPILLLQKDIVTNSSTAERHCYQFFYCSTAERHCDQFFYSRKTLWPINLLQKDIVTNCSTAERHCDQLFYYRKTWWPIILLQKDMATNSSTAERYFDQFF